MAGALQNAVLTYIEDDRAILDDRVILLDDILVLVAFTVSIARWGKLPGSAALCAGLWIGWLALGLTTPNEIAPFSEILFTFRQVVMPVAIIVAAMTLSRREWRPVETVAIAVALANSVYCLVEKALGVRPIDPSASATRQGVYLTDSGLPGYYISYFSSAEYVRAGGIFLNPAIAGIACAVGAVLTSTRPGHLYRVMTALMTVATLLTFSRAGMLIIAIALAYATFSKVLGRIAAVLVLAGAIALGSGLVLTQGSEAHSDGFYQGVREAFAYPLGRGFGYAGNIVASYGDGVPAESLAAIAFTGGGLLIVALFLMAIGYTARPTTGGREETFRLLALALLLSAAFAETAGAVNATVPAWAVVGLVLARSVDPARRLTRERRFYPTSVA